MIEIEFWHWWVLAAALGALDMLAQSGFLLWLGVASLVVGLGVFVFPDLAWQTQILTFAVVAITAVLVARPFVRRFTALSEHSTLNRRGEHYVGQLVVLESAIVNGRGRAYVGDSLWTVVGGDNPVGATVRVVGADGASLLVEKP